MGFNVYGVRSRVGEELHIQWNLGWLISSLGLQHLRVDIWGACEEFQNSVTAMVTREWFVSGPTYKLPTHCTNNPFLWCNLPPFFNTIHTLISHEIVRIVLEEKKSPLKILLESQWIWAYKLLLNSPIFSLLSSLSHWLNFRRLTNTQPT